MPDVPGDSSTTIAISVGGSLAGNIESSGDHDWYRIELTAGQQIDIAMVAAGGSPMEDPYLRIRDASGQVLAFNDDGGEGRNGRLGFEASYTGTYYIDAAAWAPEEPLPGYTGTGTYQLSVSTYSAPPEWTNDQIANQLTTGYWDGSSHRFDVSQGGTITVNLTALAFDAQGLARQALTLWSDVIGVTFSEVAGAAQINFDDDEEGAHASAEWNGGIISSVEVNIAADWASGGGNGLNSYRFQTYLHEVGHALGLGHAGDYNEQATYPFDASFSNDGWPATLMSYFAQDESSYYQSRGFSYAYTITPMVADVIAIGNLYGLSKTTRVGDTVYGIANSAYGTLANREVFNASLHPDAVVTIFDSGGTDTLNYSTFGASQRLDLNPESFSNVAGLVGNLSIARGVSIENAIGGSGADLLIGNSGANLLAGNSGADTIQGNAGDDVLTGGSGADILTGGAGADTFLDTRAGLNGDTIVEFSAADRILFTDATLGSFTFSFSGAVLTYSGGSLTINSAVSGEFSALAGPSSGVELRLASSSAQVPGGSGNDNLVGTAGSDILFGYDGDDILSGGAGADILNGGNGNDILSGHSAISFDNGREADEISGGAGNDTIFAGYGDIVDGGDGFDTVGLSYVGATQGINGDTAVLHSGLPLTEGGGTIQNIERFSDIALTAFDDKMVIGDQDDPATVRSWDGNDHLVGQEMSITMFGGNGDDLLVGSTANDYLYGENGNDILIGYLGSDELWGGGGADRFVITHLDPVANVRDFEHGIDKIDLSALDANMFDGGDQAFTFIGTGAFTGVAGQLRTSGNSSVPYVVEGDVNGDGSADFIIHLGSPSALTQGDFLL